jgi:DNA-binding GntR family transcriptional regulator
MHRVGSWVHLEIADGDRNNFIREDMNVHHLIYRASANAHLVNVLIRYDNLATRIWCLVIDRLPDLVEHIRDHAPLLEAIADGEGDAAAQLALDHVTGLTKPSDDFYSPHLLCYGTV